MDDFEFNRGCSRHFVLCDASRHYFQFYLPDGQERYRTCTGGIVSLVLGLLLLTQATTQFIVYFERSNYTITEKNLSKALDNELFGRENGFAIAATFSGTSVEDPEIGLFRFYIKHWNDPSESPEFT